jgi:hypothetical protein
VTTPPTERFDYIEVDPSLGPASALPYASITLQYGDRTIRVSGLVDSGATLNVLPYDVGLQLGATWERQTVPVRLAGNMADAEARALVVTGKIGRFAPVRLAFAWTRSNRVPVILGQTNFFMEFDIRFCRSQLFFEIEPREKLGS